MVASIADSGATAYVIQMPPGHAEKIRLRRDTNAALLANGPAEGNEIVILDRDEWYPVYEAKRVIAGQKVNDYSLTYDSIVEVPGETLIRWRQTFEAFYAVQKEMRILQGIEDDDE